MARKLDNDEQRRFAEALLRKEAFRLKVDSDVFIRLLREERKSLQIQNEILEAAWLASLQADGEAG
jgi:hypothetical protein